MPWTTSARPTECRCGKHCQAHSHAAATVTAHTHLSALSVRRTWPHQPYCFVKSGPSLQEKPTVCTVHGGKSCIHSPLGHWWPTQAVSLRYFCLMDSHRADPQGNMFSNILWGCNQSWAHTQVWCKNFILITVWAVVLECGSTYDLLVGMVCKTFCRHCSLWIPLWFNTTGD